MSLAPSRRPSLRKPAVGTSQRDRSASTSATGTDTAKPADHSTNISPSRLPTRHLSISNASSGLARTTSISRSTAGNGSMRPPPRPATVSRPPITLDNSKTPSLRSGSRTPTDSQSSNVTLQRKPSTRGHSRNASTSSVPSRAAPINGGGHSRTTSNSSSVLNTSSATVLRPPSQPHSQPQSQPASTYRPAFSTLQQHYSPLKSLAPKPQTAFFLAPPSPSKLPSNIALSAEISRLQAELLQLHLLHSSSSPTQLQFHSSARTQLQTSFEDVKARHDHLIQAEKDSRQKIDTAALKSWADTGAPGWGLEEKIQVLSQVLTATWALSDIGGRYSRNVRSFERWLANVQDIMDSRKEGDFSSSSLLITALEPAWHDESAGLDRRLAACEAQLRDLGDVGGVTGWRGEVSSLERVLRGVNELVKGMGDEVRIMLAVEQDVLKWDGEWIRAIIEDDDDEDEVSGNGPGEQGPSWRVC